MTTATLTRETVTRETAIKAIRAALRARSGKAWSVTGGRGTAWGWLTISAPPARCDEFGYMSDEDRAELGSLLGMCEQVHPQGESVPSGSDFYLEYVALAEGRVPEVHGVAHWD